jgi:hypothetical protein
MRAFRALGLLAAAAVLSQCGLPSSFFLNPPGQGTLALPGTPNFYVVSNTTNSETEFRGFDLYYKFFSTESSVNSGLAGSSYSYTDLVSAGFMSVCANTDSSASSRVLPLITVPTSPTNYRGTAFAIEFTIDAHGNFSYVRDNTPTAVANPEAYGAPGQDPWDMRRSIEDITTSHAKVFTINPSGSGTIEYTTSDGDFSSDLYNALNTSTGAFLAMYAVSVGYDSAEGYIRSYPIFLGYVRLSYP